MSVRHLLILPWLLSLALWLAPIAHAQEGELRIEQSESVVFGNDITFVLTVQAPTVITGAQLILQPADREPITEVVPVTAGTSVYLTYRVDVNAANIPPFASLTYRWQLRDETGGQINSEPRTFRYEDNQVPWEWQVTAQDNIFVHTDGQDSTIVAQAALDTATEAQTRVTQMLQTSVPPEIRIYVYPELAQLVSALRVHNRVVQDWVAAYALPDQAVILIAASPGPEMLSGLQRDIPHELTHVLVYAAAGPENAERVPGWFNEGLALMSAYEPDPTLHTALADATREGVLLSLDTLCVSRFTSLPPQDAALAYAQSESIMRYVSDRYGSSQIRAMLTAYAEGASCSGGVQQALGISLSTLESQWHNSLRNELAHSPSSQSSLVPWLVVWAVSLILATLFVAPQPPHLHERDQYEPRTTTPFSDPTSLTQPTPE